MQIMVYEDGAEALLPHGGGFWHNTHGDFIKCQECFEKDDVLRNYVPCEVFSRTVGYIRPVKQMNPGKQLEYRMRKMFKMDKFSGDTPE